MTEVQNRQGEVRDLSVSSDAGVVTIAANDMGSGARVTTFLMGEAQAASLRDDLSGVTAPAASTAVPQDRPMRYESLTASNSEGTREVKVTREHGDVVIKAYAGSRRRVSLRMTPETAAELGFRLADAS